MINSELKDVNVLKNVEGEICYTQRHLYMNISNYDSLCHSEPPKAAKNLVFGGKPETIRLRLRVTKSQNYVQLFLTLCITTHSTEEIFLFKALEKEKVTCHYPQSKKSYDISTFLNRKLKN